MKNITRVVDTLNLGPQGISNPQIQQRWPHVRDILIDIFNKDVSNLIRADLPRFHVSYDVMRGNMNVNFNQIRMSATKRKERKQLLKQTILNLRINQMNPVRLF